MANPETRRRSRDALVVRTKAAWLAGAALVAVGRPDEALTYVNGALAGDFPKLYPSDKLTGELYMARALAFMYRSQVDVALPALQQAYNVYVRAGETRSQALALRSIGSIYLMARDYTHALRYYAQAQERFAGDKVQIEALHANRGQAFMEMGRPLAARAEFEQASTLATATGDVAAQMLDLGNLAYAQLALNDDAGAQASLNRGYRLASQAPSAVGLHALDWVSAELALRQHDARRAAALIDRMLAGVDLFNVNVTQRDWLRTGYQAYKAAGQSAKALTFLEAYKRADDKARSLAASAGAALMSARFDYVNQQAQIRQLHATQEAQAAAARAKLRTTILNAALLAAFVILALLLVAFNSIRRSRDQVRAANADLSQSNTALEKALAARTEFLAMTSHEIRTPLNGILGMTQVLLADRGLEASTRGKIELVHGAGETMKALVDDLLDVAKMANGEIAVHKAEMDLARLLRDAEQVWSAQAQARGLTLALAIDTPPGIVEDEVRLRQIVFNLMANAIKFTDRGEVRLAAHAAPGADGERLRIAIRDSGIGIPADKLEDIFESFRQVDAGVTRRHGGTGLGLAICRNLARAMGGDVTVESALGAGSVFTIDLPLERVALPPAEPARETAATSLAEATLLVVEANPISQSVLRSVLGAHATQIHIAGDAGDAGAQLGAERIDLVLVDGATLGLDPEAAAALAATAARHGTRIALLWPQPDDALRAQAEAAGIACVISKPIGAADLVTALRNLYKDDTREHLAA